MKLENITKVDHLLSDLDKLQDAYDGLSDKENSIELSYYNNIRNNSYYFLNNLYSDFADKLIEKTRIFILTLLQEKIESGVRVICNAGKNNCAISAYGDVFPCIALPIRMGNLQEQSFKAIWQTTSIDEIRYMTVSDLSTCSKCELLRWCVRCPGAAYLETDNFHNPSSEACRRAGIYYEREQSLLKKGGGEWTTTRSSTANRK